MRLPRLPVLLAWAALLVVLLALLERLALFVGHSAEMLTFPWQVDFDEGIVLHSAWLLAQGRNPYPVNSPELFVSSVYPPLFYALNAIALKLWGLNLWSGRALSLLGTLLAGGAIAVWAAAETRRGAAGVLAGLLWLLPGPVIVWATFYKQDILALGCGVLGCAMIAFAYRQGGPGEQMAAGKLPRLVWWAILPLLLAFWTKQSVLAPLAAAGVFLLLRDWRSAVRWGIVTAAVLLGPFLLLNFALQGQLYHHLDVSGDYELSPARLLRDMNALLYEHWPIIIIAAGVTLYLLWLALRTRKVALSLLFAAFSTPILILTNLSPHANYNHLLDGLLPLCLLVGVGVGYLLAATPRRTLALLPLAVVAALLVAQVTQLTPLYRWYSPLAQPLSDKAQRMQAVMGVVQGSPGTVLLTEDDWMTLLAGKTMPWDDTSQMATQSGRGKWDQTLLLAQIAQQQFPLLLLEHDIVDQAASPRWTPEMLAALQANYTTQYRDVRFLYVPVPTPTAPTRALDCPLDGGPTLAGVYLPGDAAYLTPGATQKLSLYWAAPGAATVAPRPGLKFSTQLLDPSGKAVWQADVPPGALGGQAWPNWAPGAAPRDDLLIQVPANAAPGHYTLTLSAYEQQNDLFVAVPFACAGGAGPNLTLAQPQVIPPLHD